MKNITWQLDVIGFFIISKLFQKCHNPQCNHIFDNNITLNKEYPKYCGKCNRICNEELIKKRQETVEKNKKEDPTYYDKIILKREQTSISRHGTSYFQNLEKTRKTRSDHYDGNWHPKDFGEKVKKKKFENHGDQNWNNREKAIQTCNEIYGVDNPFQIEEVKEKCRLKHQENYGVDNPFQSDEIKEKCRLKHQENYGVDNVFQSPKIIEKCIQKHRDNYGVDWPSQNPEFLKKIRQTYEMVMIEKYGVKSYFSTAEFKQWCIENYGVENPMQSPEIRKISQKKYFFENYEFDSGSELLYFIWLKDNQISFIYQPSISFEYEYDNKTHKYFPDFCINNQFIEIKGDHFFNQDGSMKNPYDPSLDGLYEAKHQCMIKNNVKIIRASELDFCEEHFKQKYGSLSHLKDFRKQS